MATFLISLGYLVVGSTSTKDPTSKTVKLYNGHRFSINEMRAAEYAIFRQNLTGHQWIGDQLQVPTNRQAAYTAALEAASVLERNDSAQQTAAELFSPWQNAKAMESKMLSAKELDSADAIKRLPGIADAIVVTHQCSEWERNVWARKQVMSAGVFVEAHDNRPISVDTIQAIGKIVAPLFGITDMSQISIVDTKSSRAYDGAGVVPTVARPQTAVETAVEKAGSDIGKFRLPIEYTLHNIPAESLIDFLAEEFPQVKVESPKEESIIAGTIEITASLTDHRAIKKMLIELECEIEVLHSEAAGKMEESVLGLSMSVH